MRKRTVSHIADTIFWYILYFLPVLAYLLYLIAEPSGGTTLVAFDNFFSSIGLSMVTDNIIVNSLSDIFGTSGIMPLFSSDIPFIIFAWFIGVYLIHLCVDFLLFIPRLAHKWMKKCTGGDE